MIPAHANGDGPHPRYQAFPVRLIVGATYRFKGHADARGRWLYRPGDYRLVGWGEQVHTWQEVVAYVGLAGRDAGRMYVCTLADWAANFTLVAGPPVPEKVLDHRTEGSGV